MIADRVNFLKLTSYDPWSFGLQVFRSAFFLCPCLSDLSGAENEERGGFRRESIFTGYATSIFENRTTTHDKLCECLLLSCLCVWERL